MSQPLGTSYSGTSHIDHIPAEQRIYDRDKKLVRITRGRKVFSQIMMENFKRNTVTAKDPEPKYKSDVERNILFQMAAASTNMDGGTNNRIYIPDKIAVGIQVNDQILCENVFYNGTTYSTTRSTTNPQKEMMFVLQKGTSDGTMTWFKVQRGYAPYTGGSAGTPIQLTTSMYFTLLPQTVPVGTDEAISWSDTPAEETNYCQIFLEKWSVDETTQNTSIYQDETVLARNGRRALELFFRKLENAFMHGHKGTGLKDGRRWWTTGGFEEYVYQANPQLGYAATQNVEDFQATYGAMSLQNFNAMCENKFYYGNPDMKFMIMGATAYTKYCNAVDPKVRIVNPELVKKYGIQIVDHLGSNGGIMHIVRSDDMSLNMRSNEAYVVDFSHFQYMHLQNMDLQIIKNVEKNPHETVHEIYGQIGVHRTNPFAHWIIYNF